MPLETIQVTIGAGSANPQTKTVTINVDPNTGTGTGQVSYSGVNGGLDSIKATATIAGTPLTSNLANVGWQGANGIISLVNNMFVEAWSNPGDHTNWNGTGNFLTQLTNKNSVIFNQVYNNMPIVGIVDPLGVSGEFREFPPYLDDVKSDGTALTPTGTLLTGFPQSRITYCFGSLVIQQAGTHTFYFYVDDSWALYVGGGATRVAGSLVMNGGNQNAPLTADLAHPGGPIGQWPLMGTRNTAAAGQQGQEYVQINFPAPGVYPFLTWWINNADSQSYFQFTATPGLGVLPTGSFQPGVVFGSVIKPVDLQNTPPATVPSGQLQLSIQNGNLHIVGDTVTLGINVNGIHYQTKPYVPVFEGTTGKLYLFNDPSNPTFTFPVFNGNVVDPAAAAPAVFQINGSNGSWQGRLSVVYNATDARFELQYNGNNFDSHVDITTLTLQADDISWYNGALKTFDLFTPSVNGGGVFFQIEADYMVKPSIASVSPLTVTADGGTHIFTINLDRPFSPQQQGAKNTGNVVNLPVVTMAGCTVGTPTAILDGQGWLTGWNVPITVPSATTNQSAALVVTVTGTLTYLSSDTFVNAGAVTYINNVTAATITRTGVAFTPPAISAFSVSPTVGAAPAFTINLGTETLTATVVSNFNNTMQCAFWRQQDGTSTRVNMGNGTLTNSFSSSGQFFFVFTFSQNDAAWYPVNDLGAQATDTVSGLQSNLFFDSSTYTLATGGGGGGGGGCPAVEMWLDEWHQAADVFNGMGLDILEPLDNYAGGPISHKTAQVEAFSFSDEPCFQITAENGASVIVSETTPVPTREGLAALAEGISYEAIPIFAPHIHAGLTVITDVGNGPEWSMVTETKSVGVKRVVRVNVGGNNFAAGVEKDKYIYTHNVIEIVK